PALTRRPPARTAPRGSRQREAPDRGRGLELLSVDRRQLQPAGVHGDAVVYPRARDARLPAQPRDARARRLKGGAAEREPRGDRYVDAGHPGVDERLAGVRVDVSAVADAGQRAQLRPVMPRVHTADRAGSRTHDERLGRGAAPALVADPLEHVTVGDTRRREEHVLTGDEVVAV